MTDRACLASLELLALRSEPTQEGHRDHLRCCPRCLALSELLPATVEGDYVELLGALTADDDGLVREAQAKLTAKSQAAAERSRHERRGVRSRTRVVLFGEFLREAIEEGDWDEVSLAERAQITGTQLTAFLDDRFDLRFRRDTGALASVLSLITDDPETVARGPLCASLLRGEGGLLRASEGGTEMLAASSFAGVSKEQREMDLWRDQVEVDESDAGRRQAAELYVEDVLAAL